MYNDRTTELGKTEIAIQSVVTTLLQLIFALWFVYSPTCRHALVVLILCQDNLVLAHAILSPHERHSSWEVFPPARATLVLLRITPVGIVLSCLGVAAHSIRELMHTAGGKQPTLREEGLSAYFHATQG